MYSFSRYSNVGGGFGGGGGSGNGSQQSLSNIYNSLSSIQNSIGNVNSSSVPDGNDTLLKNQQDLEDLLNNKLGSLTDAIITSSINDISSNKLLITAILNYINSQKTDNNEFISTLVNKITESRDDIMNKIITTDASLNKNIIDTQLVISNKHTDLISRFDASYNSIYDKIGDILIANSNISESLNDNFTDLMISLNIKSNETQQSLMQYIGKYIVVPLYEQRLNDIVILYYERFNNEFLSPIETLLNYFRKGNFSDLTLNYNQTTQEIMAMKLLNFKNQAFEKLLSTSPDAKGFNDMTEEAIKYYKQLRNYVSWGYKSLDGLSKAIELNNKAINLEAANELGTIDKDILNDPEKLAIYLEILKKTSDGTLFSVATNVNISNIVKLQPKFQEYVCRHGWPENGNFEAKKMAIITKDLIAAGVLPDPGNVDTSGNNEIVSDDCTTDTNTTSDSCPKTTSDTDSCPKTTSDTDSCPKTTSDSCPKSSSDSDSCPKSSSDSDSCPKSSSDSCPKSTSDSCPKSTSESCPGTNDLSCNTGCDSSCNTGCDPSCNTGCDSSCNTGCDPSCNTGCDPSCNTGCDSSCNTGCDPSCNTGCDPSCNTGCDPSCNTGCDPSCNTGCDPSCNTGCDASCNVISLNECDKSSDHSDDCLKSFKW